MYSEVSYGFIPYASSQGLRFEKVIAESVSPSEVVTKDIEKLVQDTLSSADQVSPVRSYTRTILEALSVSDGVSKEIQKAISENLNTFTESLSKEIEKSVLDTVNTTDTVDTSGAYSISINDTLNLSEAIAKSVTKILSDSIELPTSTSTGWEVGQLAESEDVFGGGAWTNLTNAQSNDGNYASVNQAGSSLGDTPEALKVTNFGFNIPTGATIEGVEMRVRRYYTPSGGAIVYDFEDGAGGNDYPRLVVDGAYTVNSLKGDSWATSAQVDSFSSSSELWGHSLTPTQVNDVDFGVIILPVVESPPFPGGSATAYVDYVEMKIHYTDVVLSDSLSKEVSKAINQFVITTDERNIQVSYITNIADAADLQDVVSKSIQKVFESSISIDSVVNVLKATSLSISETSSISETLTKEIQKNIEEALDVTLGGYSATRLANPEIIINMEKDMKFNIVIKDTSMANKIIIDGKD